MSQQRGTPYLSAQRLLCHALLWHPLYRGQIRDFVGRATDDELISITISVCLCASGYGLTIGGAYGVMILYLKGFIQAPLVIFVLIVLLGVFVASARAMERVRKAVCNNTQTDGKTGDATQGKSGKSGTDHGKSGTDHDLR